MIEQKGNLINRRNPKITAAVLAVLFFLILIVILFPMAGTYILSEDELAESDIIVILMGSMPMLI